MVLGGPPAEAAELWLPASHQQLMPRLRQAAEKVEATAACEQVMQGSLHSASEDAGTPVFALVCRDVRRYTYPVFVDAGSLEVTYPAGVPSGSLWDWSTIERRRQGTEACETLFAEQTRHMLQLQRLQGRKPWTRDDGEVFRLVIDFDARTPQGQPLHYRAECRLAGPDEASLVIRARRQS